MDHMDSILIGLDLGTTNAKAAAYTLGGELITSASIGYPTYFPEAHRVEQRPMDWISALTRAMQQVVVALGNRRHAVVGIGLSAQGPSVIFVDDDGALLTDSFAIWQDTRSEPYGRRLVDAVGADWIGLGAPLTGFPARLLCALEEQPELRHRARYALNIKDFLVNWLTGTYVTEPSSGPAKYDWWSPVFEACGWSLDRLAKVMPSTTVVGPLLPLITKTFGLSKAIPVVIGLNDGGSATVAGGIRQAGENMITVGTNGAARVLLDHPVEGDELLASSLFCWPYLEGQWVVGGVSQCGAAALEWFVRVTAGQVTEEMVEAALAAAAASPIGSSGVVFQPFLSGRGAPTQDATKMASFCNLRISHERGDLARAVLEGVAYALRDIREHLHSLRDLRNLLHVTGGGMRSPLWRQILADVCGTNLVFFESDSALGAAIIAAVALGHYADTQTAMQVMTRPSGETVAQPDAVKIYHQLFTSYIANTHGGSSDKREVSR